MTCSVFYFNDTATTEIYTLSLHDALPIYPTWRPRPTWRGGLTRSASSRWSRRPTTRGAASGCCGGGRGRRGATSSSARSEEHTSELQSRQYLVCRLLLEKKKKTRALTAIM